MLEKGEIDLMSNVSYTPERAERMLYPSFPMGSEEYYLFVSPSNREILPTDFSTQNGKRIGVNKNSVAGDLPDLCEEGACDRRRQRGQPEL